MVVKVGNSRLRHSVIFLHPHLIYYVSVALEMPVTKLKNGDILRHDQ